MNTGLAGTAARASPLSAPLPTSARASAVAATIPEHR